MSTAMKAHLARGVSRLSDYVLTRGSGSWLWTQCGRKLLDMTSGIGVVSTGHCHPRVVAAAQAQVGQLIHGQVNIAYHDRMLELTEALLPVVPAGLDSVFYTNSGAEAVENAVKMARHATGRPNVIVMQGGYHGRTMGTMAMTSSSRVYRQNFGPLMPGVLVTPFPFERHGVDCDAAIAALELLLQQQAHPSEVAALVLEPVLGEGGYVPAPADFLPRLQKLCKKHGILLVCDEVQTGFGRTGSYFACDSARFGGVTPDILVTAKGIASGFPLAAVWSRRDVTDRQEPGTMGGTYTGNAVACAAALATQEVMRDEQLVANSARMGERFKSRLREVQRAHPEHVVDVRGAGCMVGVELRGVGKGAVTQAALRRDVLLLGCSVFDTVRFIPPLTVSASEVDQAVDVFEQALVECINNKPKT